MRDFHGQFGTKPATKEATKQLCESFSDIVELRLSHNSGITLVRPDGYVAYATQRGSAATFASLRSILERQTRSTPEVL
jgi:hypothetical protein